MPLHKLLSLLPPEAAHTVGKWAMRRRLGAPGPYVYKHKPVLFGHELNNPLGLAAGFDKNGELVDQIEDYGFGWVEVGSVTWEGSRGNPNPRMFRVPGSQDIMNRMGLNGDPATVVYQRLRRARRNCYAVNIAKSPNPKIIGERAIADLLQTYRLLGDMGIYTVLNLSCPNTEDGKTFEDPGALRELLVELQRAVSGWLDRRPLLVKVSPGLVYPHLLARVMSDYGIAGCVCSNTMPVELAGFGRGGRSGRRARESSRLTAYTMSMNGISVIACGGIFTAADAVGYMRLGPGMPVNFFQAYNGFVRGPNAGPRFAHTINQGLEPVYAIPSTYRPARASAGD